MKDGQQLLKNNMLGGIIFVLLVLLQLGNISSLAGLLLAVGYAVVSVALFLKRRDAVLLAGVGILTLLEAYYLLRSLFDVSVYTFFNLISLAAYLGFLAILLCNSGLAASFEQYRETARKYFFAPAALIGITSVLRVIALLAWGMRFAYAFRFLLDSAIEAAGVLFVCGWVCLADAAAPSGEDCASEQDPAAAAAAPVRRKAPVPAEDAGYCSLVKHVLLLLFTFGIWYLIWIYRMTGYLNRVEDEEPRTPSSQLLLCMFVPFYGIFWIYKSAQRIDKLSRAKGIPSEMATLCLILAIFVGILPPILMQDKVNTIITSDGREAAAQPVRPTETAPQEEKAPVVGGADELKKYKELLDLGAITQEEYDAKKKQLLGL